MSRRLNVTDGMAFINAMSEEMLGINATVTAVDTSTFASVGETLFAAGTENVMNTLSLVASRDLVAIRPYEAKFRLINSLDSGLFSNRIRKISYLAKYAVNTGAANTQVKTNLAMGYDNGTNGGVSTEDQYYQSTPVVHETWFGGGIEWQYPYTLYEKALKEAFRSPEAFTDFLNGFLVSAANDMETEKEAFSRLLMLNAIAGTLDMASDMPGSARNLTTLFNTKYNVSYTSDQWLQSHFTEFLEAFVAQVKTDSDMMTNRSLKFHWSPSQTIGADTYELPRQTKKEDQRMMMISEFWNDAEARVLPAIFNDRYLKLNNFEKVDYWQNINEPMKIDVVPAIPDTSDPTQQIAGAQVQVKYVIGVLFDKDAIMVDFHLEDVASTPLEARKKYRTVWNTINKNPLWDPTENMIVYYLAD